MKQKQTKISMVTAYDFPSAKADMVNIDMILVGDSLGMMILRGGSTYTSDVRDMIHHGRAVSNRCTNTFVVVDMPIGAVGISISIILK